MKINKILIALSITIGLSACATTEPNTASVPKVEKTNANGDPEGYEFAALENQMIKITGTVNVAYGAKGNYVYAYNQTKDIKCHNSTFKNDPIKRTKKQCYIQKVK